MLKKEGHLTFLIDMTESDLPYLKPEPVIPPEANEVAQPSPDIKNPLPNHDPIEKDETEVFICPVCRKSFNNQTDLDLHLTKNHWQTKKV
jgi:hypothetical protein